MEAGSADPDRGHLGPDCHLVPAPGPWGTLGPDLPQPDCGPSSAPSTPGHTAPWGRVSVPSCHPSPPPCAQYCHVSAHTPLLHLQWRLPFPSGECRGVSSLWGPLAPRYYEPRPEAVRAAWVTITLSSGARGRGGGGRLACPPPEPRLLRGGCWHRISLPAGPHQRGC